MATRPATDTQWTIVLALTALFLSAVVTAQILSAYAKAYMSAPAEVYTFVDAADSSVQENESYDRDVSRVRRLEDKLRLGRLLREIQKCGDDLREELNGVLMSEDGDGGDDVVMGDLKDYRLTTTARVLWASKRRGLEDKVRRLDMLRMRFLVVYLGIVSNANAAADNNNNNNSSSSNKPAADKKTPGSRDAEKFPTLFEGGCPVPPQPPPPPAEGVKKKPMARRLSRAIGHSDEKVEAGPRRGWAGVMMELQMSPLLHKRRASVEKSTSRKS